MTKINWNNFNGTTFQKFCNTILLFNVSRFAQVFSKAGKDSGIDQLYHGEMDGKNGQWRFQDKFHNSGKTNADFSEFKRDISNDIKNNHITEDFIVYITNINLSTSQCEDLKRIGCSELTKKGASVCQIFIWHHATLEGFIAYCPLVYHWFWEKESMLLQSYQDYFRSQLSEDTDVYRHQLKNRFFGRESEISKLEQFLDDPVNHCLALVANGGYGKTRLIVEFCKKIEFSKNDWVSVIMSHSGFDPGTFQHLLKSNKRLLIFIDNANEIPEKISDVLRLVRNMMGKHKLLITTRPTLFSTITGKLPSESKNLEKMNLTPLSYEITKGMLASELPGLQDMHVCNLAQISKGVPNVILELIRLIKNGKQPYAITTEETFNETVNEIFSQAISDIGDATGISKSSIRELIELIAIISPVSNNDEAKEFIAKFINVRKDQVELILSGLLTTKLIETTYTISIKPDPYSDSLLSETVRKNQSFINHVLTTDGTDKFIENILRNLSEAEVGNEQKEFFIDRLLDGYVSRLNKKEVSNQQIKTIFTFVDKIAFRRPKFGIMVVGSFLGIAENRSHQVHDDMAKWGSKSLFKELEELTGKILTILCAYSRYGDVNQVEIFELIIKYIKNTGEKKTMAECYRYRQRDLPHNGFWPTACCIRQNFLKDQICTFLRESENDFEVDIAIKSADFLMVLEFDLEHYYEHETSQMYFGHGLVPMCDEILEIRSQLLRALMAFYSRSGDEKRKDEVLNILRHFMFYSCNNYFQRYQQDIAKEIYLVLNFFASILTNTPTTHEKNHILSSIQRFEKAGFRAEFRETVSDLKLKASSACSLNEDLELCLRNEDYFDSRANLEPRIKRLISEYASFGQFKSDLINIRLSVGKPFDNFQKVLAILSENFRYEAKIFFEEIQNKHEELAGEALFLITNCYKDTEFFGEVMSWLWNRKDKLIESFFWLLIHGRSQDIEYYQTTDLDYFEYMLEFKSLDRVRHYFDYHLASYAYIDRERTFHLLDRYLKTVNSNDWDKLCTILFSAKEKYAADFKPDLKKLLDMNLNKVNLNDDYENYIFRFVDEFYGFDELCRFILAVIEVKFADNSYWYFDKTRMIYTNDKISIDEKIGRFMHVLDLYVNESDDGDIKKMNLLDIFRPDFTISDSLCLAIEVLLQKNKGNNPALIRLAKGLQSFNHNIDWVKQICSICELLYKNDKLFKNYFDLFGSTFSHNLGSKSKIGRGVPYQQDLSKKALLEHIIEEQKYCTPVLGYLNKCLKKVETDIKHEIESDELAINW